MILGGADARTADARTESRTQTIRERVSTSRAELVGALRRPAALLLGSRLIVWIVAPVAFLTLGVARDAAMKFDPKGISTGFGAVGNALAATAVRWDAIHYLSLAHSGYTAAPVTRFFPLYPMLIRAGSWLTGSTAIAGVAISLAAGLLALVLIGKLTTLELGRGPARLTVALVAFGPLSLYLSAAYTESLYLLLSIGTLYAARRGRWTTAGILGCLTALTRVTGVLLVVPVLLLFLYGPRGDRNPRPRDPGALGLRARLMPRYPLEPAVLWAALIPLGTLLFAGFLTTRGFGPLSFLNAQSKFAHHHFELFPVTLVGGLSAAGQQLGVLASGATALLSEKQGIFGFLALAAAVIALVGVFRRLPPAYGAYVVVGLLVPLTSPTVGDPLKGLARYVSVLVPLYMWAGVWAHRHQRRRRVLLGVSIATLVLCTVQFATWHVVGSASI